MENSFLLCLVIYNQFLHSLYRFMLLLVVCFSMLLHHGLNWFYLMRHDKIPLFIAFFSSSLSVEMLVEKFCCFFFVININNLHSIPPIYIFSCTTHKKLLHRLYGILHHPKMFFIFTIPETVPSHVMSSLKLCCCLNEKKKKKMLANIKFLMRHPPLTI